MFSVGVYVAIPAFTIFHMRHLGQHPWITVLLTSLITPVVTFLFFATLPLILPPKGTADSWFSIFCQHLSEPRARAATRHPTRGG